MINLTAHPSHELLDRAEKDDRRILYLADLFAQLRLLPPDSPPTIHGAGGGQGSFCVCGWCACPLQNIDIERAADVLERLDGIKVLHPAQPQPEGNTNE